MKVFIRKVAGEGVALLGNARAVVLGPSRPPTLVQAAFAFLCAIAFPLAALALMALAAHFAPDHAGLVLAAAPIVELRAKKATLVKEANDALTAAQAKASAENRVFTAEEKAALDAHDAKLAVIDQQIETEQKKLDRERSLGTPTARVEGVRLRADNDVRARGFQSPREFLQAVIVAEEAKSRDEIQDERLRPLAVLDKEDKMARGGMAFMLPLAFTPGTVHAAVGSDEQGAYSDAYGGVTVAKTFIPRLLSVGAEADPSAGRTQDIPMETPSVEIPARTDKNHTTSVTGGFTFARRAEAAAAAASRGAMELVTMKAASLFGLAYATQEILTDSALSFVAIIESGFRDQLPAHLLNEKLRGLGGDQFQGVLNSTTNPSLVSVAKESGQVADTIVAANVIKMRSRCWGYGNAIWIANHDTYPQLATMSIGVGTAGALVYQQSVVEDRPDMLLGRPIYYSEYAASVGDAGDILLANWSQYLEGLYQPLQSAESVHVRFVNHESAFKVWLRNAGAPWWRTALTPNKSSQTLSPFVVLDAR